MNELKQNESALSPGDQETRQLLDALNLSQKEIKAKSDFLTHLS
ncbi:MAG: hypothetical protein PHP50_01725 [Lachnospiraceae bacterium]|nr:hypothetical protein [Lachnospiraceae bacterium]